MMAGVVHELRGAVPQAREAYEKALALNPRFVPAANNLAWLYTEHGGDRARALKLAQMARELSPDDPRITDTLGWILYRQGAHERALELLKESAGKLPDNPQVQYHLGMAHARLGDTASARKALAAAVTSPEDFLGKEEARKTLAELR
jgi:tetratricopeptide (TPR) repeat protein